MAPGAVVLVPRAWRSVLLSWCLVCGAWCCCLGAWCVALGVVVLVPGVWRLVLLSWCLVFGSHTAHARGFGSFRDIGKTVSLKRGLLDNDTVGGGGGWSSAQCTLHIIGLLGNGA